MKPANTIIFDLDGTLLDTLDDLANSVNHALGAHGYPLRSKEEIRRFLGNGIAVLLQKSVPEGTSEENCSLALNCFRQHYVQHCLDLTRPYDGILPLLQELARREVRMAIVSNKLHPAVQELNERFFKQYINSAVGESATVRRKPNPDAVIAALRALGSEREEALYVGDSEVDLATARNAGIPCVCVSWGFRDRGFLETLRPDALIDRPEELLQYVRRPDNAPAQEGSIA